MIYNLNILFCNHNSLWLYNFEVLVWLGFNILVRVFVVIFSFINFHFHIFHFVIFFWNFFEKCYALPVILYIWLLFNMEICFIIYVFPSKLSYSIYLYSSFSFNIYYFFLYFSSPFFSRDWLYRCPDIIFILHMCDIYTVLPRPYINSERLNGGTSLVTLSQSFCSFWFI